jgi:hypothetical protein
MFTIKYGGEEKQLPRDQVINLAQQGYDYTTKTQRLSEQQRQWEAERQATQQEIAQYKQYAQQVDEYLRNLQSGEAQPEPEPEPQPRPAAKRPAPPQFPAHQAPDPMSEIQSLREQQYMHQMQDEMRELNGKYEWLKPLEGHKRNPNEIALLALASLPGIGMSPSEIAQEIDSYEQARRQSWEQQYLAKKQQAGASTPVTPGGMPPTPGAPMKPIDFRSGGVGDTLREAFKAAGVE